MIALSALCIEASATIESSKSTRAQNNGTLSCRNPNGEPVDFWVALKFPRGYQYAYADSSLLQTQASITWTTGSSLNSKNSFWWHTHQHLDNLQYGALFYNDEDPDGRSHGNGHMKGTIGLANQGGFWIIHSIPRFPQVSKNDWSLPTSAWHYGQSAICVSFAADQIEVVTQALKFARPHVYSFSQLPQSLVTTYPGARSLMPVGSKSLVNSNANPQFIVLPVTSRGGYDFNLFIKSPKYIAKLHQLIGQHFQSTFAWETWRRLYKLKSCCQPQCGYDIENVEEIRIDTKIPEWKYTLDHSKWGISLKDEKQILCIGDLNRASSQEHRGGGFLCMNDPRFWRLFADIVSRVEACSGGFMDSNSTNYSDKILIV